MLPSLSSGVYLLCFQTLCTVWSVRGGLPPLLFSCVCVCSSVFSAGHLLLVYCYQLQSVQEAVPPEDTYARYTHTHTHTHTRAHGHTHAYTPSHAHIHTHGRTRAHTHACTYTLTCTHIRTHVHAHTHTRARTHTHTLVSRPHQTRSLCIGLGWTRARVEQRILGRLACRRGGRDEGAGQKFVNQMAVTCYAIGRSTFSEYWGQ